MIPCVINKNAATTCKNRNFAKDHFTLKTNNLKNTPAARPVSRICSIYQIEIQERNLLY